MKLIKFIILGSILIISCKNEKKTSTTEKSTSISITDSLVVEKTVIYTEDFTQNIDNWIIEQMPGGTVEHLDGKMEITDARGCTVWFKEKLKAPILIEYEVVVIENGGVYDRVSDLNCFWLATDPQLPDHFFAKSDKRSGKFQNYDSLRLYYVGLGGHHNTKTRFRRYSGNGSKPLLPEHDLFDKKFLITPNTINHIKIVVFENYVQYYRNDHLIYDFYDTDPYVEGYFAIRTVNNHMTMDNFRTYELKKSSSKKRC